MFPISTKAGGMSQAMPDVCKTPSPAGPVPIPYPNIASFTQADPSSCSKKVKILNQPIFCQGSKIMMTSGDEAGSVGGLVCSKIKGTAEAMKFSMKLKVEGKAVVFHTCMLLHNDKNTPPAPHSVPSQTKVFVGG